MGFELTRIPPPQSSPDGNVTVSTLSFVPSVRDASATLVCRSGVMGLPESTLEDTWKLEVHCESIRTRMRSTIFSEHLNCALTSDDIDTIAGGTRTSAVRVQFMYVVEIMEFEEGERRRTKCIAL